MRYRSVDVLDEAALGCRVTIRFRLPDGQATDVVGVLIALSGNEATVRDKHQQERVVERSRIIASRIIRSQ
jgi:hypothetical protein